MDAATITLLAIVVVLVLLLTFAMWVVFRNLPFTDGDVFRVDSRVLFADVLIETTGGSGSIRCTGHHKSDAARMKTLIEQRQSEYYRPEAPLTPVS